METASLRKKKKREPQRHRDTEKTRREKEMKKNSEQIDRM
jgi:hypothetical protein